MGIQTRIVGRGPRISRLRQLVCLLTIGLLSAASAAPAAVYVDDDAPLGGDGASWATAYRYLQDALAASVVGTEIRVAGGLYRPDQDEGGNVTPGDRSSALQLVGVTLLGGYAGLDDPPNADRRDTKLYTTLLSGDLAGNDTQGFGDRAENSYHVVTIAPAAAPSVIDGVTVTGGNADGSDPDDAGGGIYVASAWATIGDSRIAGNRAARGGAIHNTGGPVTLAASVLAGNEATSWGGAIDNFSANLVLVNSVLVGNRAGGEGGAVHSDLSNVTVTNCAVVENVAGNRGGGLFNYAAVLLVLTNDIVWANRDASGTGEEAQVFNNPSNSVVVNHTDLMGWTGSFGGAGNLGADPLFVRAPDPGGDGEWDGLDDDYGDVRPLSGSPCIDTGDNNADVDAITPGLQPLPASDLAGNPRIAGAAVDMGAFEAPDAIPTVSAWGVVLMALLVLSAGTVLIARRLALTAATRSC